MMVGGVSLDLMVIEKLLLKVCGKFHCYREMDTIFSGIIADTLFFVSSQKLGYQPSSKLEILGCWY